MITFQGKSDNISGSITEFFFDYTLNILDSQKRNDIFEDHNKLAIILVGLMFFSVTNLDNGSFQKLKLIHESLHHYDIFTFFNQLIDRIECLILPPLLGKTQN